MISKYVDAIFTRVENGLAAALAGSSLPCTAQLAAAREAEAAESLRELLFDVGKAVVEPERDLERSACYLHDAQQLEWYLTDLIKKTLEQAKLCNPEAHAQYLHQVKVVWKFLYHLRRLGLDPEVQVPVMATEPVALPSPPPAPTADDALCPYHSAYASPVANLGCWPPLPSSASQRLTDEANFVEKILLKLGFGFPGGIASGLPALRQTLSDIWIDAANFVLSVGVLRPPAPLLIPTLTFTMISHPNADESGCLGWPSDVGGIVSAEGVPLQDYFPVVLTRELAEVVQYLRLRERPEWFEYTEAQRREREASPSEKLPPGLYDVDLQIVNREHLGLESFSTLTIREPQQKMAAIADLLHTQTRDLAGTVVSTDSASTWPPPDTPLPPLRNFAKTHATFLSRMCINRGCNANLLRTVELAVRHECFSSFLMHLFFEANPTAGTLPACRILYTE